MSVVHPSPEIPQGLVDKIVARRGRLHVHDRLDPSRTALVVIDMDVGSCAREPESAEAAIERINAVGYEVTMVSDAMVGQSFGLHEASLSTFFRVFGDVRPASDVVRLINGFERPS